MTIDGAILTLKHSFFVDNYDCGGGRLGTLTVHGAIAQFYRGIVGQMGTSGYLKNYNYDDRLGLILPPYLFDLQNTQWGVYRETPAVPGPAGRPRQLRLHRDMTRRVRRRARPGEAPGGRGDGPCRACGPPGRRPRGCRR